MPIKKLIYYKLRMFVLPGLLRSLKWHQALALLFSTGTVPLLVAGIRHPVLVRAGTSDIESYWEVFVRGVYDSIELERSPGLVVDAGACAGYASIRFANRWPEAEIIAVEPEASNAALCRRNTRPYRNVRVVEAGLWPRPGKLKIANPRSGKWGFEVETSEDGAIPAITLDELTSRRVDLLKMDIEGAERYMFLDSRWMARVGVAVVETETHSPPTRDIVTDALERDGRKWTLEGDCVVTRPTITVAAAARRSRPASA